MMEQKNDDIKRMAELLRQGETLTDLACPVCASPLFRLKNGTLWCAKDQKRVVIVTEDEQTTSSSGFDSLEETLLVKVQELQNKIKQTDNVEELQKLSAALSDLLNNLEKIRKMKKA